MKNLNIVPEKTVELIKQFYKEEVLIKGTPDIAVSRNSPYNESIKEVYLYGRKAMELLPFTVMPIYMEYEGNTYILMDVRQFVSRSPDGAIRALSTPGVNHATFKTMLYTAMLANHTGIFRSELALAGNIFVNVISNLLSRDWDLRAEELHFIKPIIAIYYGSGIPSIKEGSVAQEEIALTDIIRWSDVPSTEKLDRLVHKYPKIESPEAFIDILKLFTNSPRMKAGLTYGALLSSFVKVTYGPSGVSESLAQGINKPFLFTAVVMFAVNNSMTRNSLVGKELDRFKKKDSYIAMEQYIKSVVFDPTDLAE